VLCHYYGREAGVELREDIDTVLEPGMVVSMEPMIMLPEGMPGAGGYREHDILIVTETGPRTSPASPSVPSTTSSGTDLQACREAASILRHPFSFAAMSPAKKEGPRTGPKVSSPGRRGISAELGPQRADDAGVQTSSRIWPFSTEASLGDDSVPGGVHSGLTGIDVIGREGRRRVVDGAVQVTDVRDKAPASARFPAHRHVPRPSRETAGIQPAIASLWTKSQ
jgi:hypothetical protein